MTSSFPKPLIDLLREALQALECGRRRLCPEKTKVIDYLRQLIIANDPNGHLNASDTDEDREPFIISSF
jgi:hypothetical protein